MYHVFGFSVFLGILRLSRACVIQLGIKSYSLNDQFLCVLIC